MNKALNNIRFSPNMDEWSIMTRLQDFEAMKKKQAENDLRKQKQREVTMMLNQQTQDMQRRDNEKTQQNKLIDKNMIDLDKKLFEEQRQKQRDREQRTKQIRQETLQ